MYFFFTMYMQAAILGDLDKVQEIVQDLKKHSCEYLIDITTEEDGYNMLHFAVCYKRLEIVEFLIENRASESYTQTHIAIESVIYQCYTYYLKKQGFKI